ncbi:Spermidine/putrescine transport system permease protein PotB [bioreactor metagenome]|uniref:Spermidine/putrescine transport system permease protein PotB n=1 Tax=bioreactor metagenome TaxID=1076179 RepID=A0A644XIT0_9ZZZZ
MKILRKKNNRESGAHGFQMKRSLFATPYIVWMAVFILSPMLLILYYAFTSDGAVSIDTIVAAASWDNLRVLLDSVRFALYTTVLCLLLGYPVAYLLSRMNKSVAALLSVFFVVPMWMNFLLRTYAWKVLLGAFTKILYTEAAVLLGMVYNFLPFMILPIYTTLIKLDKSYIEAASDLGANPATTFTKVVLPLSMPGVISGITMVFIPSTTTFAISQLLGGGKTMLYGDLIYMKFITEQSWNAGSALSVILLVFVLISMTFMKKAERGAAEEGGGRLW